MEESSCVLTSAHGARSEQAEIEAAEPDHLSAPSSPSNLTFSTSAEVSTPRRHLRMRTPLPSTPRSAATVEAAEHLARFCALKYRALKKHISSAKDEIEERDRRLARMRRLIAYHEEACAEAEAKFFKLKRGLQNMGLQLENVLNMAEPDTDDADSMIGVDAWDRAEDGVGLPSYSSPHTEDLNSEDDA